jgi:hypothetical protein
MIVGLRVVVIVVMVIVAMIMIMMMVVRIGRFTIHKHVELGRGNAVANRLFRFILGPQTQMLQAMDQLVRIRAGVNQRTNGHVSTYAGEGIKIGYAHQ